MSVLLLQPCLSKEAKHCGVLVDMDSGSVSVISMTVLLTAILGNKAARGGMTRYVSQNCFGGMMVV